MLNINLEKISKIIETNNSLNTLINEIRENYKNLRGTINEKGKLKKFIKNNEHLIKQKLINWKIKKILIKRKIQVI